MKGTEPMKTSIKSIFAPNPTPEQAQAAAKEAAEALVAAGRTAKEAQAALEAAHDASNPEAVIQAEAALFSAQAERDRADLRHKAALRRVEHVISDRLQDERAEQVKALRQACKERLEAAEQIDAAYAQLGDAVARFLAADEVVAMSRITSPNAFKGSNYGTDRLIALLNYAAVTHRIPGAAAVVRSREEILPTAAETQHDNETILLGVEP
jgi:hypothetical protein